MLELTVLGTEHWDEENKKFQYPEKQMIKIEHSLVSLSKWESIHEKAFIKENVERTQEEIWSYIECMITCAGYDKVVASKLSPENLQSIVDYIHSNQTATHINEPPNSAPSREVTTSELIYYWMFSYGIPKECEDWFLNRLIMLIKVFSLKNAKPSKMSRSDLAARHRAINKQNRAAANTKG